MLHNLLGTYKEYLQGLYSKDTAATYSKRLSALFSGQPIIDTADRLDIEKLLKRLSELKYKNDFSQAKNAFLHFCEFQNINLPNDVMRRIRELEKQTRKKYRKLEPVEYVAVDRKIKSIRNKKLKLSYQVMGVAGFRVSELADITAKGCTVSDNEIAFSFRAKGGKKEVVTLSALEYPKLYQSIKALIENTPPEKKLFYSAAHLQKKATELGFKCHDLRRIFAKLEYKKSKSKIKVMEKLRHSNMKNTNIYLRSKVKF